MAHKIHMVMDFQFGSTGKGLLAGWLAKREGYDTAVCSFATNAGHTYIDKERGLYVMTQQLPTAITSPTVKNIVIGPGALIHIPTLMSEINRYKNLLAGKYLLIHPHAAIVTSEHEIAEMAGGMTKIGSTAKGVGAAMIQRIRRDPDAMNVAGKYPEIEHLVAHPDQIREVLDAAENVIIEGAQGFSLSMYHGMYPYTTSRDVTPWQISADCGLPFKWAPYIKVMAAVRTYPIRVNNRDGTSGPGYDDQPELDWQELGLNPEKTTVTKLPRRIFQFSQFQMEEALWHCGQYWNTNVFLNFANYVADPAELAEIREMIEASSPNKPNIAWTGWGPDDSDVRLEKPYEGTAEAGY